jgi:AraC-like DNA-binding protein
MVATLHGVTRRLTARRLAGAGWTVAALTRPGGLAALVPHDVRALTDRAVPLGAAVGRDEAILVRGIVDAGAGRDARAAESDRVDQLRDWLTAVVAGADPARVAAARNVSAVAGLAETDRTIRRLADLATAAGTSGRTLQRLFAEFAGVTPTWLLRRYRILEAAEHARTGEQVRWADLAVELGYSDQAHLIRDFRAHLGVTPAAYAARQRA